MTLRDLRRHVGQLAIVGFQGQSIPTELAKVAAEFDLGGVVYFARNIVEPRQVAELSREAASLSREWPLWIGVDQEGGRVARLRAPFTEWPPAITLGRSGDEALASRFADALATELLAVGINIDFAPVLDVLTNRANTAIGDRALSDRADDVARFGAVIIRTLQQAGLAACAKHFPGHGDTGVDSHDALPIAEHDRRRLDAVELVPFKRAIAEGVAAIMTAHVLLPAFDEERPATLSRHIVQKLLKESLGFQGVAITDDLGMKAVSASATLAETAVEALEAGCDAVLLCNSTVDEQVSALEAIIRAAEDGRLKSARIDDALARQHRVKAAFLGGRSRPTPDLDTVGALAHRAVALEMAEWR